MRYAAMRNTALVVGALTMLGSALVAPRARADVQSCMGASDQGQALRDEGKLRAARLQFLGCAVDTCPPVIQRDCTPWLADIESRLPSVIFSARDAASNDVGAVRVLIDGAPLVSRLDGKSVPVDPGEHTFRFEPEQGPPIERRAIIRENDKGRLISVVLPSTDSRSAAPSPPPQRAWLSAVGDAKALQTTCWTRGCSESDLSPPRTKALVADVFLGVGAAAAIGAAAVFVLQKPSDRAASLRVSPSTDALVVSLHRPF
jgi:hypothetical protein